MDGKSRALEIIDTAGQEEYKTLRDIYFKDSDGFVLVYSITSPQSFMQAQKLKDRLTQIHGPGKPIIIAGNKLDLEADREVPEDEAYQYAVSQQVGFFECSAKVKKVQSTHFFVVLTFFFFALTQEFINVTELFCGVVRLIDRYRQATETAPAAEGDGEERSGKGGGNSGESVSSGGNSKLIKKCVIL